MKCPQRTMEKSTKSFLKPRDPRHEHFMNTHGMNQRIRPEQHKTHIALPSVPWENKEIVSAQQQPKLSPMSSSLWKIRCLLEDPVVRQKAAVLGETIRIMAEANKKVPARKLCLVLDLHQTLVHSAKFDEIKPAAYNQILRQKEEEDRAKPQRHLYSFPHLRMWIKLRPGIWNFLEKASQLYELHLSTMGSKAYAKEMERTLDPTGILFGGRIISKGGEKGSEAKDLGGVSGTESTTVIIDDSISVWPNHKRNLIAVPRYIYFPCVGDCFLSEKSLLEMDHDERAEDGTLASILAALQRIHQNFFMQKSLVDTDVRIILASEQRKVLAGCRIIFTGLYREKGSSPQDYSLWQMAERFGAACTDIIDEHITHVVSLTPLLTYKVKWAQWNGRYLVNPDWVTTSVSLYRRMDEHDFPVKSDQVKNGKGEELTDRSGFS